MQLSQEAVARGLEIELERLNTDESYFKSLPKLLESKRDYMAKFLVGLNLLFFCSKNFFSKVLRVTNRRTWG